MSLEEGASYSGDGQGQSVVDASGELPRHGTQPEGHDFLLDVQIAAEFRRGEGIYDMTKANRGFCIIINNKRFANRGASGDDKEDRRRERHGSDIDADSWAEVFQQLSFTVARFSDLSAAKMEEVLEEYSLKFELAHHNAIVVIIMSHGHREGIEGTDGRMIKVDELVQYFNNARCPQLINKPKLFLIQACRGEKYDYGVHYDDFNVPDAGGIPTQVSNKKKSIPTWSDMVICHSTMYGYVALRNIYHGSWFGDAFRRVLVEHAHDMEFHQICNRVNVLLMAREGSDNQERQSMEVSYRGWNKDFYFNPGHADM